MVDTTAKARATRNHRRFTSRRSSGGMRLRYVPRATGGDGQDEKWHALPDRVAEHERKLLGEGLRVARGEERREEPPEGHHRRDRAEDDVRGAEVRREGGQDRRLRDEREADHEKSIVSPEGED